jgi:hypothetical protein
MGFRSKRTFKTVLRGQLQRRESRKKISKVGLSWMREIVEFGF